MNLYIKYLPLAYTYTTRITSIKNLIYYLGTFLGLPIITVLYLGIFKGCGTTFILENILLFLYLYITYNIFYEVGYITNDIFSIRKEKKPTKRIKENLSDKFRYIQIILRIILGGILLFLLRNYSKQGAILMIINILTMECIYIIHNLIRNYSINMITGILLRITKMIPLIILFVIIFGNFEQYNILIFSILFFEILDLLAQCMHTYNERLGGINALQYGYSYFFITIMCCALAIIFQDCVCLLPLIILIPKIFYFLINNPKFFSLKDSR